MASSLEMPLSRLDELLADRALIGLDPVESAELDDLLASTPDADPNAYERAAAAALLALVELEDEPLPSGVRSRIETRLGRELRGRAPARQAPAPSRRRGLGAREALAWAAAAAALVFALLPAAPSDPLSELRQQLAREGDTLTLAWTASDDPAAAGAGGRVLWSNALQQGVMVFRGLEANDPSVSQYQLWIFDAARDAAHPVDGGVFDVAASGDEVVVPIRATLPVAEPTLFAVTIERPGGVVVSGRERLPLLAKVADPE